MTQDNQDLTKGPLARKILFFSAPLIVSNLLQVLFNVADIAVTLGAALLLLYFVIDIIKDYKNKKKANDDMLNANEEKNGNSEESNIAEQKAD